MAGLDQETERAWKDWLGRHRASIFQPWVKPEDVVLEFGARDVWNLKSTRAGRKHACAIRGDAAGFVSERITLHDGSSSVPEAFADVVICDGILEYLLEPINAVLELKKALKPGGKIIVQALYDPAFRRRGADRPADHYYSWNVQTLGNLLVDCGFDFLEGKILRQAREEVVRERGPRFGFGRAAWSSKMLDPVEKVWVVAAQPG